MKKRIIQHIVGTALVAIALLASLMLVQSMQQLETPQESVVATEVDLDNAISVLP